MLYNNNITLFNIKTDICGIGHFQYNYFEGERSKYFCSESCLETLW